MPVTSPSNGGTTHPRKWTDSATGIPGLLPGLIGELPPGTPSALERTVPVLAGVTDPQ